MRCLTAINSRSWTGRVDHRTTFPHASSQLPICSAGNLCKKFCASAADSETKLNPIRHFREVAKSIIQINLSDQLSTPLGAGTEQKTHTALSINTKRIQNTHTHTQVELHAWYYSYDVERGSLAAAAQVQTRMGCVRGCIRVCLCVMMIRG